MGWNQDLYGSYYMYNAWRNGINSHNKAFYYHSWLKSIGDPLEKAIGVLLVPSELESHLIRYQPQLQPQYHNEPYNKPKMIPIIKFELLFDEFVYF